MDRSNWSELFFDPVFPIPGCEMSFCFLCRFSKRISRTRSRHTRISHWTRELNLSRYSRTANRISGGLPAFQTLAAQFRQILEIPVDGSQPQLTPSKVRDRPTDDPIQVMEMPTIEGQNLTGVTVCADYNHTWDMVRALVDYLLTLNPNTGLFSNPISR